MTAPARLPDEQTVLPESTDSAVVIDLLQILRKPRHEAPQARAKLVSADGARSIPLPDSLRDVLVNVLEALAGGYAVTIGPKNTTLTTEQAADMLGISRPTLTEMIDEGEIPSDRPNSHRRIKLSDLLDYQRKRRQERPRLLQELTKESIEMGLYDLPGR